MRGIFRRIQFLLNRRRLEQELADEMAAHREMMAADRRHAFGNTMHLREQSRDAWGWTRLEQLAADAGYGLRQLRQNPGFSAIAIATLALGIGGMTAMFSAFDAVLIRELPYASPERLVMIWDDMKNEGRSGHQPAPAEYLEWRRHNTVFTDIAATQGADATLSGDEEPEQVPARKATWNLWNVLGVQPMLGRGFTEEEDDKGIRVVVISYDLWQSRFGGSPQIIGRKISLNDQPYEVVGVMPRGFFFMPSRETAIWMPTSFPPWMRTNFGWHNAQIVARLKDDVTLGHARISMAALSRQITAKDFRGPHTVVVNPLRDEIAGRTQAALTVLLCASGAFLLIACVNLANLLMSRGAARGREVAVRAALGAGRGRIAAQFLTESLVLAGLGCAAGLALALPAMRFLERLVPEAMGAVRLTLDSRVLAFSAAVGIAAVLIFGLAPALRASRAVPQEGLRDGGRGSSGPRSHRVRYILILVETALAVVLLTCGGLLLQTFEQMRTIDLGIRSEKLLTFEMPLFRYPAFERRVAYIDAQLNGLRSVPGVVSAGAINRIPLTNTAHATFYSLQGQSGAILGQVALNRNVSRGYFATIGARLREGRDFSDSDRRSDSPVAIINEALANRHFPGRSPLGQRLQFGELHEKGYWYTVVGVVKQVRDSGMLDADRPAIYRVLEQCDQVEERLAIGIMIRTAIEPESIIPAVRQAVWSVDRNQALARMQTMEAIVDRELSTSSQSTALLGAFALLALVLASLGTYGVLSYAVTQRTREIGVRMALGAASGEIMFSVGNRGLALTAAGLVIGLVLAVFAAKGMGSLFYDLRPDYLSTIAAVSILLFGVGALASFIPAYRASRVDPVIALRNE